jgi:hypothetical protein
MANTTGVVLIDDPKISKIFCQMLLQVQGRLMCRSVKEGMIAVKAVTMISSDSRIVTVIHLHTPFHRK